MGSGGFLAYFYLHGLYLLELNALIYTVYVVIFLLILKCAFNYSNCQTKF